MSGKIDELWYPRIDAVMNGGDFIGLNEIEGSTRAPLEQRQAQEAVFLAGETRNPNLRPQIDLDKLQAGRDALVQLEDNLQSGNVDPVIIEAYVPRIREMLCNADTLEGAATGDSDLFMQGGLGRFGEPDTATFNQNLAVARQIARQTAEEPANPMAQQNALEFLGETPDTGEPTAPQTTEQFERARSIIQPIIDEIVSVTGEWPVPITGAEAIPRFQQMVDHFGFGYMVVPQKPGLSTMAVMHSVKEVRIPVDKVYEDPNYLTGLALHEIWIHVNEAIQGAEQPLELCARGLDRFLFAGEGKGLMSEQLIYPSYDAFMQTPRALTIIRRHLAIGAARGLVDGGLMDFKEVYGIINKFDRMQAAQSSTPQVTHEEIVRSAHNETWELLSMRTHKGHTGHGMASLQDKVYAEGNGPQMRLLADHPEIFPYLNLGKYNLLDPKHVSILKAIGTLPEFVLAQ